MSNKKMYQITSFLQASSIIVLMEHDATSTDEIEIKFGDFTENDVAHTIDEDLKAHLETLKGKPTSNLAVFEETLVTIEDNVVKFVSTLSSDEIRDGRPHSPTGNGAVMETY